MARTPRSKLPLWGEIAEGVLRGERLNELSLWQLVYAYNLYHRRWSIRIAAEVAFALAMAIKRESDRMGEGFKDKKEEYLALARQYARDCMAFIEASSDQVDDATLFTSLAGVAMPNRFYADYLVKSGRFPDFVSLLR